MPSTRKFEALGKTAALAICLALATGCALHRAKVAAEEGRYDEALAHYRTLMRKDPNNIKAKIGYRRTAPLAAEQHLKLAREAQRRGQEGVERKEVAAALVLDPSNAVAADWMVRLEEAAERRRAQEDADESVESLRQKGESKAVLPINPRSLEGMDLNFTRKTSLREILMQLSKNSGVNIILHSSATQQDVQISVDLRGLTFQRILDTLMLQSDLFYRVMDTNTIMVFKKSTQNLTEYENKLIKTFYLSNAEVDSVRSIFNALMPQLRVFVDKRLNAITAMAKQSDLAIAQRIVNQLDKAKAEVMVYIELLEVSQSAKEAVGLLPLATDPRAQDGVYRMGATLDGGFTALNQNKGAVRISKSDIKFLFPSLALDFLKANGDGKLLASPNVRVVSGETGEVNIGEKISTTQSSIGVPGLGGSTTSTATSSLGSYPTQQTQYSYEDVGVKIKVKPRVHFNNDITLELETDIKTQKAGSTAGRPDLSQRIIKTFARLKDGETAVFGGLLKEDEQKNLQGIWGITDIPILGRLLGNTTRQNSKTDVLLTIRAVVVRKPDFSEEDFEAFDPDQAPDTKPFLPKTRKGGEARTKAPEAPAKAPEAQGKPEPPAAPAPVPQPAPSRPAPSKPAAPPAEAQPAPSRPAVPPAEAQTAQPAPQAPATPQGGTAAPEASELVFFMDPISGSIPKGKRARVSVYASGGQGLTSGSMDLRLDPRLKLVGITPGDFLTSEGGALDQTPGKDGGLVLNFKRRGGATDSGTFAVLELEGVETGKGTVLIQGGRYLVGANPISARVVNAMITVE
jgi:type II secretory pathway component GspD/PulD (secretin)